jgi:guanosine-diphosphatase
VPPAPKPPTPKPPATKPGDTVPERPPAPPSSILTFKTDPDPAKTVHCTSPYSATASLVQWALMIDAGSTGSRIHIYKFHNCNPAPEYEYEVFKMTQPGLSSFSGNPDGAAQSLDALMDEAVATVPEKLRKCTPVAVKATAGLRLLGPEQSTEILQAVRGRLEAKYPFPVVKKDGVVIMEGKDEGTWKANVKTSC